MYQVLLVDSQVDIVESIEKEMPWSDLRFSGIFNAFSGKAALKILESNRIDMIITEIRIPGIDGLELINIAKQLHERIVCILLTDHEEFEYAKRAIELQVIDYLMKPVRNEQLLSTIRRGVEQLENGIGCHEALNNIEFIKTNLSLLQSGLLIEILEEKVFSTARLQNQLSMYKLPIQVDEEVRILIVELGSDYFRYTNKDRVLLEYCVMNIVQECCATHYRFWGCQYTDENIVLLLALKSGNDKPKDWGDLSQFAHDIQNNIRLYLRSEVSIYVSKPFMFPTQLVLTYHKALTHMHRCKESMNYMVTVADMMPQKNDVQEIPCIRSIYSPPTLIQLMGRNKEIETKLQEIFEELATKAPYSQEHILEVYYHLIGCFIYICHRNGITLEEIINGHPYSYLEQGKQFRSWDQLKDWCSIVLQLLNINVVNDINEPEKMKFINQIHQYIEENLTIDVGLQSIAKHVFVHPVYLSKMYKEITGTNLSEYIFMLRMIKAKHLLVETNLRIYEITEKVGYQSAQHFIREYKRYYGYTPNSFRKLTIKTPSSIQ